MKRKLAAIILGISLTGALACGAIYGYASGQDDEVKLQIAGQEDEDAASDETSEDAAEDAAEDATEDVSEEELSNTSGLESTALTAPQTDAFTYASVADVAENVMPAVVSITNKSVQEVRDWFSGRSRQYESESAGSGIIVGSNEDELLICTNNHVVDGASTLTVSFIDENSYEAVVKGTDPYNDLAVVAVKLEDISEETMQVIRVAQVGDSDNMRVGEQVIAIGNALGYGQSVTTGIISAKDRTIKVQEGYSILTYENLIQTDAAINPGNSGGALLNMSGEVIGINSAKAGSNGVEGMGYAIPISKAMPILEDLMARVTRTQVDPEQVGFIGITGDGVSSEATQLYGIPQGVYVISVGSGTPAEDAGLLESDIITKFDGRPVTNMNELQEALMYYSAGETVEMTVYTSSHGGAYEEETLTITLGSRADYQS